MRNLLLTLLLTTGLKAELKPLFDGQTLEGWEGDTAIWRVVNGEIVAGRPDQPQPYNDFLCTRREYGDFDLQLEYRRAGGNGGIQFHSQRMPDSHEMIGFQADFAKSIDGFLYDESRRRKFLAQPDEETIARLDVREWNRYHLRVEGARLRLWLNGVQTVDYLETDPAIPLRGHIGLQLHKAAREIRYRRIWLEELQPAKEGETVKPPMPSSAPSIPPAATSKPDAKLASAAKPTAAAKDELAATLQVFDGLTLAGWHYKDDPDLGKATESIDGRYTAKDGVLTVNPEDKARGPHLRQLWTVREFPSDFTLSLEFRAGVDADSGIFIRGNQLQCRDYAFAGPPKYKALKSYRPQDWNKIEIVVRGTAARCTLNGEVMEQAFKVPSTGPLGLEADRGTLEYRNLVVSEP